MNVWCTTDDRDQLTRPSVHLADTQFVGIWMLLTLNNFDNFCVFIFRTKINHFLNTTELAIDLRH